MARWLAVAALGVILTGCGSVSGTLRVESPPVTPPTLAQRTPPLEPSDAASAEAHDPTEAELSAGASSVAEITESLIAAAGVAALGSEAPATPVVADVPHDTWMAQARDPDAPEDEYDPWEPFNERMFEVNRRLDRYILKPVAKAYNFITPDELQIMISNGFDNISFPPRFVNSLLQGKWRGATREIGRFLINSTIGVGGLFDPAKDVFGLVKSREDFGQTLGFYGVGPGPFLIMPLMEPMTVRDGVGKFVDSAMDPLAYYLPFFWDRLGMKIGDTINERSLNLELFQGFEESVIDLYSAVRHGYLQRREKLIRE